MWAPNKQVETRKGEGERKFVGKGDKKTEDGKKDERE